MNIRPPKIFSSPWLLPALIVAAAVAVIGWLYFKPAPEKAGQVVVATESKEVAPVAKESVPVKAGKVTVYQGGAAVKKKLTLPQPVVDDKNAAVLASSKIPAGERPHTVTTVLNTETGASETYVRTDPLPWLAYENRGEIGLYYGIKNGQQAVRLQATQDLVQVKALHLGVIGSMDMANGKPDLFVGVGVAYRW